MTSPYRPVARIRIPSQKLGSPEQAAVCERLSFNPWHALPDHRPLRELQPRKENDLPDDGGVPTAGGHRWAAGRDRRDGRAEAARGQRVVRVAAAHRGAGRFVEIRNELRENLHDTEEPAFKRQDVPATLDAALRESRTTDGTYNDLAFPKMGRGQRFGRNVPLEHTFPDTANLLRPNPRTVSRELMTRDQFQPATILNLLAASWIQFMVHDWFVHKRPRPSSSRSRPPRATTAANRPSRCRRSMPDPAPAGSTRPPAYANLNSHWWDASQIYGCEPEMATKLRAARRRQAAPRADRAAAGRPGDGRALHRVHRQLVDRPGDAAHALHPASTTTSAICWRTSIPTWNDEQLYRKAQADQLGADGEDSHRRVDAAPSCRTRSSQRR